MSFAYARPGTIADAQQLAAAGGRILAGGQSLMPIINRGDVRPKLLVDINRIAGLDTILRDGDHIEIGALARLETVRTHPLVRQHLPLLAATLAWVANPGVRLRGTLVGNLVNFGVGAEAVASATLQGAELVRATATGTERSPLGSDHEGHFALAVRLRCSPLGTRAGFYEAQRRAGHLGTLGAGIAIEPDGTIKAVASGLLAGPLLLTHVADAIALGHLDTAALSLALADDLHGRAIRADIHATARYRELVAPAVIRRAWMRAVASGEHS